MKRSLTENSDSRYKKIKKSNNASQQNRHDTPLVGESNKTDDEEEKLQESDDTEDSVENDQDDLDEIYDPYLHKKKAKSASSGGESAAKVQPGEILVILDLASLEIVKTKRGEFQLLNCDDHISLIRKFKKNANEYRPDIIHQELMAVLDSPLNKHSMLKILVHTEKNVLFDVNCKTRIPRTYKRFSGLMVQLLHKLKIRSADGGEMLLKVVKNPLSRYIPPGAHVIGFSHLGKLYSPTSLAESLPRSTETAPAPPIVLLFGAQATRGIQAADHPYMHEMVSISEYPLSGVVAINRVLGAIEHQRGIV